MSARNQHRRPRLESLEARELLTAFAVTNPNDSGAGSLRDAIMRADADAAAGVDTISFAIGSGAQTITPASPLPAITRAVAIDGSTQPAAAGATSTAPRIVIDGSKAGAGADGLTLTGPGGSTIRDLAIVNFGSATNGGGRGILVSDAGGDTFAEDYLGIAPDGRTARPNVVGIEVRSANNVVGSAMTGAAANTPNLISGNTSDGILITGTAATGNQVVGNLIGTDITGQNSVGNLHGVTLAGASNNTIGGTSATTGNLISGNVGPMNNTGVGVYFTGVSSGNVVAGNLIGTDASGARVNGNAYGIYFGTVGSPSSSEVISATTVGGAVAGAGNTISGNGIGIAGNITTSTIQGNRIGTDSTGAVGLGNGYGIYLGANGTTIGGTITATRNIIAASGRVGSVLNGGAGITLSGDADTISGNVIGTSADGTTALPNVTGIVLHTTHATIGGTAAGAGNIIAGNTGDGLDLDINAGNSVYGNLIGSAAGRTLGNGGNGIGVILAAPTGTTPTTPLALADSIGGVTGGMPNIIAGNGGDGVAVINSYGTFTGLSIRGNQVANNGGLGISIGSATSAPTPQTLAVTSVTATTTNTTITGVVGGTPGQVVQVDLYNNATADPTGYGEGQVYLGSTPVTIGAGGLAQFSFVSPIAVGARPVVAATVTDASNSTSEYSADFPNSIGPADLGIAQTVSAGTITNGGIVTFTATITNGGTATAHGVVYTDALPTSLVNPVVSSSVGATAVEPGNVAQVQVGDLAPGASATITISANTSVNGTISNTAGVIGTTPDPNYANNLATQSFVVGNVTRPTADLGITMTPSSTSPTVGAALTYTLTVTNAGPADATNVTVNDFLPAGATLVSATPSQGAAATTAGTLVSDNLGTIVAGGSATVRVVVDPTTAGTLTNSANVSGGQLDAVTTNNSASSSLTVGTSGTPALALTQALTPTVAAPGQPQLLTLTITNNGTGAAVGVVLVDTLPAGSTFVAANPSQGAAATVANGVLTSNLGTIAAGASATVAVAVIPSTTAAGQVNYAAVIASGNAGSTPVFSTVPVATPAVAAGPTVASVTGSRSNAQLVVTFSEPITARSATTRANYRLYVLGTSFAGDGTLASSTYTPVPIASISYNAATNRVTLTPSRAINSTRYYELVVVGNTAAGIADTSGRKLVGVAGGAAGTNFASTFLAGSLPQA